MTPANRDYLKEFDLGRISAEEMRALLRKSGPWGRWQSQLEFGLGCLMVIGMLLLVVVALGLAGYAIWRYLA